jgi:hypothetical protein
MPENEKVEISMLQKVVRISTGALFGALIGLLCNAIFSIPHPESRLMILSTAIVFAILIYKYWAEFWCMWLYLFLSASDD